MITVLSIISVLALSIVLMSGCSESVAIVNGVAIKQSEVDAYINFIMVQDPEGAANLSDEEIADIEVNIIDSLLVGKLIEKYAEENNIIVAQEEIDEQINTIIASYPNESDFESDLKAKNIERKFFEYLLKSNILSAKIIDEVTASIIITEEMAKEYYEENKETLYAIPSRIRVSHILSIFPWIEDTSLEENDLAKETARDKIKFVAEQLENGAEFGDIAREFSDDAASSADGGDLGFITKGEMVEEFEKAAFSLEVGEVSGIIETQFGYHILKVFDREEGRMQEYNEVKETILKDLSDLKKSEKWEEFIMGLIENAEIEYLSGVEGTLKSPASSTGEGSQDGTNSPDEEDKLLDDESIQDLIE